MTWGLLLLVLALAPAADAASVKEMDKKIRSHRKDLEELESQIQGLEAEKGKLRRDEQSLSRTLKRVQGEIDQSKKRQSAQKRRIRETEAEIQRLGKQVFFFSSQGLRWEETVLSDLRAYYVHAAYPQRLETRALERQALLAVIALKAREMKATEAKKDSLLERERRMQGVKQNLVRLRRALDDELGKQEKLQAEKNQLYKTTQGKRLIAEQEVERLKETREALEKMISNLTDKKEKTLAAQREAELLKKGFEDKKGDLPWPVQGAVVSQYGRQKHPDLNITVINSGIRIEAGAQSQIRPVAAGTVIYADDFRSYGQTVIVDHGGDCYTVYGLLGSLLVRQGQKVRPDQPLGTAGSGEASQIYFEVRNQGRSENPLQWLR